MRFRDYHKPRHSRWWTYQQQLHHRRIRPPNMLPAKRALLFLALVLLAAFAVLETIERRPFGLNVPAGHSEQQEQLAQKQQPPVQLRRIDLHSLLESQAVLNLESSRFTVARNGAPFEIQTTLDEDLQQHLLRNLNPAHARYISIVALDPFSGRILAMVSFDKLDASRNTCVEALYPAASIFKIVTAAGAVEAHGLTPDSELFFNGGKYTLYRSQLKEQRNRNSHQTSLAESFAESINPVFGKLGIHQLGKEGLENFAEAFGFRQSIPFDLPLPMSDLVVADEPFQWAEVASGYNRTTLISPLHASLIVAAVVNGGGMVEPTLVEKIQDAAGQVVYAKPPLQTHPVISAHTARALKPMMTATVSSGTARNLFRGHRTDRILSQLELGGKTGSISNTERSARFDWFVGYGLEAQRRTGLVVAVVVAHEEYIGVRAAHYARMAITHYFSNYFKRMTVAQGQARQTIHRQ